MDKVWLQILLWSKTITSFEKLNMIIYFENITVGLYIFYSFNTHQILC